MQSMGTGHSVRTHRKNAIAEFKRNDEEGEKERKRERKKKTFISRLNRKRCDRNRKDVI